MSAKLLAPPFVVLTLAAGVWFWSGVVAPGYWTAIGFGVAWFVVCSVIFGRVGKARPELRWWLRGTFLACSVAALVGFWWTSIRETEVNEQVVTGVPGEPARRTLGAVDPLAPQPERATAARRAATSSCSPAPCSRSRTAPSGARARREARRAARASSRCRTAFGSTPARRSASTSRPTRAARRSRTSAS